LQTKKHGSCGRKSQEPTVRFGWFGWFAWFGLLFDSVTGGNMPKYIIEVAGPKNQYVIFQPTQQRLRGRLSVAHVAHLRPTEVNAELYREVGDIPGIWIALDTDKKYGEILDPLKETPEGREKMAKINSVLNRYKHVSGGEKRGHDRSQHANLTVDQVKEWLHYMRQMVDDKIALEVTGSASLPKIDEIREMPGKRRRDPFNTGPQTARSQEHAEESGRLYRWADERPVGGKKELAGAGAGGGAGGK
jgi:hypothetical protein